MPRLLKHHSLVAWQRADDLFIRLHRLSRQAFPPEERFELAAQLRRAAFSVPGNIVEGIARHHPRETLQFLRTANSSLAEAGYCLHAARRLAYISHTLYEELDVDIRRTAAPLVGLIRKYRREAAHHRRGAPSAVAPTPLTGDVEVSPKRAVRATADKASERQVRRRTKGAAPRLTH